MPWLLPAGLAAAGALAPPAAEVAYGVVYLSIEEAQRLLFPGRKLERWPVELTAAQAEAIEERSGVRVRQRALEVWKVEGGGLFFVDEVIGKHEFIPYALGLGAEGKVVGVEILEYRETYGDEIRGEAWRLQFRGRSAADPLRFGGDIRNISGATLSCRHIADGVKRLLATHELALRD